MPGICGIVLERDRCRDDFATVRAFGPRRNDDAIAAWLVDGDRDTRLKDWDGMQVSDRTWQSAPSFAWWYTVGLLSVAAQMPRTPILDSYVAAIAKTLTDHAELAPPSQAGIMESSDPEHGRIARLLAAANAAIVPDGAIPSVPDSTDAAGYARLGVMQATLSQMVDNPMVLSRAESRQFAIAVVAALEALDRNIGGSYSFDGLRRSFRGDIPADPKSVNEDLREPLVAWASDLRVSSASRDALFFGVMSAQVAYNAAILKSVDADRSFRTVLFATKPYAGMSPEIASALANLQRVPFAPNAPWKDINAAATALTLAIVAQ